MRIIVMLIALSFLFLGVPAAVVHAAPEYNETVFDKMGDGFATIGKSGAEKDQILAQRKADRLKKFTEREAKKAAKKAQKEMKSAGKDAKKAGGDMKKKMGF